MGGVGGLRGGVEREGGWGLRWAWGGRDALGGAGGLAGGRGEGWGIKVIWELCSEILQSCLQMADTTIKRRFSSLSEVVLEVGGEGWVAGTGGVPSQEQGSVAPGLCQGWTGGAATVRL